MKNKPIQFIGLPLILSALATSAHAQFKENGIEDPKPVVYHHLGIKESIWAGKGWLDKSVERDYYDDKGNWWKPNYSCSSKSTLNAKSDFTIFQFRAKGAKQVQFVLQGKVNGKEVLTYFLDGGIIPGVGKFKIDLSHEVTKQPTALGGLLMVGGKSVNNYQATYYFDRENGLGNDYSATLAGNNGSTTQFQCTEEVPYLRLVQDNSGESCKSCGHLVFQKRLIKKSPATAKIKKKSCEKLILTHAPLKKGDAELRDLISEMEKLDWKSKGNYMKAPSRVDLKDLMRKAKDLPQDDEYEEVHSEKRGWSEKRGKVVEYQVKKYLGEEDEKHDSKQTFEKINQAFELQPNLGVKLVNASSDEALVRQLHYIARDPRFVEYKEYKAATEHAGEPCLSEKAFESLRRVLIRGQQLEKRAEENEKQDKELEQQTPVSDSTVVNHQ